MNQIYKIYDNGGESFDRYTILFEPWYFGKSCNCLGLSTDPESPLGFSQFSDCYDGDHLGKEIKFEDLPDNVQTHIINRLEINQ
jgi:hypothetical protein